MSGTLTSTADLQERTDVARGQLLLLETDALTGLPSRRMWDVALREALSGDDEPVYVALLELDHFSSYNDRFGRAAGDVFLKRSSRAWSCQLRPTDMIARLRGTEFAVIVTGCETRHALHVARRLVESTLDDETSSVGVAQWDGAEGPQQLLRRAREALSAAKLGGRDRAILAA
ncbi:MAG: hypothetical protein QOJ89_4063 [bacterium]|jgi:diguanylate cyclase (GGDEF)-like protein